MIRALVLGGANGVWAEMDAATNMAPFDVVLCVNQAGRHYPGAFDHWVSMHAELMPKWIEARTKAGLPDVPNHWTTHRRLPPLPVHNLRQADNWGGSSGLLAITVALEHVGADRVVACGVPLMPAAAHFDDPQKRMWTDASSYRQGWTRKLDVMRDRVRSMSGWTAQLLGTPSREWLDAEERGTGTAG